MKHNSYVWAQLPNAGLGNMLLVWARAYVFGLINELPLLASNWTKLKIGPLLRREGYWRIYSGYFKSRNSDSLLKRWLILSTWNRVEEPKIELITNTDKGTQKLYIFKIIPHWTDYFSDLKEHRETLRIAIYEMLTKSCSKQLACSETPIVSVHIRLGDFRKLMPNEDFSKIGNARTSISYFKNIINQIREVHGTFLPVSIFSDGSNEELEELLSMPCISRAPLNKAIVDMLLMSKSKVIIASAGSTFSYWAGFLSEAALILHRDHIYASSVTS